MLFLSCSIRMNAPLAASLPSLSLASHEPCMELGGAVSMVDGLAVASGTGSSEGGSLLSRSLITSSGTTEPCCKPMGLLGRAFQRASEAMVPPFDSLFSDGEQMLSFSATSKQDSFALNCDGALPSYYPSPPSPSPKPYLWNPGLYSGCHDVSSNGVLAEVKGPFTPSQWLELQNQALVYRYIAAKVPIPHNLLNPIKRSLGISGLPHFSVGSFDSSAFGWGSFYLGYSGNSDPEPGRCRRTDGKKWRCSRDAVADQKYCERHINRGRHRSRKHVEGQSSHAAKVMSIVPPSRSTSTVCCGESSSGLRVPQSQTTTNLATSEPSPVPFNTKSLSKEDVNDDGHEAMNLSISASMSSKAMTSLPVSSKRCGEFQLVSAGSHFNPESSSSSNINLLPTSKLDVLQPQSNPLHHFIDNWPQTRPHHSTVTWPEIEDMQSERTQLSMSISMASSEFSSSPFPNHNNNTLSPLKLSREYDFARSDSQLCRMSEAYQRQTSWIPISWGGSMGGPLGEALKSKTCSSSSMNILTGGWDSSPRLESSPTGVLQKPSFGSLTSSTGSSPRTENKKTN